MHLSRPKDITFIVAVIIAVAAVIFFLMKENPIPSINTFWILLVGFVVLALGNLVRGL